MTMTTKNATQKSGDGGIWVILNEILSIPTGFLAVIGSCFILLLICKFKNLRDQSCVWLIGVLAIADLLTGKP